MSDVGMLAIAAVLIASQATVSFHSWLRQRERERLTATDKAELVKRLDEVDNRIRDVKNSIGSVPRR